MSVAEIVGSFRNGVHPHENKDQTEHFPIARMAFGKTFTLPLSQHLGAPSKPIVKAGETIFRGQLLAEAGGYVSANLHSPVDGTVVAIGPRRHPRGDLSTCIEIEADPYSPQQINALQNADP